MVKHYNPTITQDAQRIFNTKMGDNVANEVNPVIQPVVNIVRHTEIVFSASLDNATSATITTAPTDKDFYLTYVSLSAVKDATATATNIAIRLTPPGRTVTTILRIRGFTLTAQNQTETVSFNYPIRVERGTTITVESDTAVANVRASGTIAGYYEEITKGA